MRGRLLAYGGNLGMRPMKDRVREAAFNLVGPGVKQKHALDLFAGTGALALEAISRGASAATLIERHFPSVRIIEQNIANLQLNDCAEVVGADTFYWVNHQIEGFCEAVTCPWVVFCSPPYDYYVERTEEVLQLLTSLMGRMPAKSVMVVESDERFDAGQLPGEWDIRVYPPAKLAIFEKSEDDGRTEH